VASAFAYPEMLVEVVARFRAGEVDAAADQFDRYLPLMRFETLDGVGAAVRKEVLRQRGVFADASTRAPGFVLDERMRETVGRLVARIHARSAATPRTTAP
jgi:4-hydroxy-tetrahydrodipicolinate synthase